MQRSCWPDDLPGTIKKITESECPQPSKPLFKFELTMKAALRNYLVLLKHGLSLESALESQKDSPLGFGSKFRPVKTLEPLLAKHPNWPCLKQILISGSSWDLEDLDEEKRLSDLKEAITRGNHKGAKEKPAELKKLVKKDVDYGFAVPIPTSKITNIPGICMAPVNIAPQNTIDKHGNIISKDRLTHDQSFKFSFKTSINSQTKPESLLPCVFGQAFRRHILQVVATRRKYPSARIYGVKVDFKSAYRRMHLSSKTALRSTLQLEEEEISVIMLRLTFGGWACPSEWESASETICDLMNALMNDPSWDSEQLFNPQSSELPKLTSLPDNIKLGEAREFVTPVPVSDVSSTDIFIDDLFRFAMDLPNSNNISRLEQPAC